jgi:hypothetical protein
MLDETDAFHAGEVAVQERAGERALAQRHGAMIRDRLSDGVRAFLERQDVVAVGAAAPNGALWASLWCGEPGFLRGDASGRSVLLHSPIDHVMPQDPVRSIVRAGAPMAMLVIDFDRRGRVRINGVPYRADSTAVELHVRESFGNCVKYIQRRQRIVAPIGGEVAPVEEGSTLDGERRAFIARIDTLFVTSVHRERGLDISHRGGKPGFARTLDHSTIRIPDYQGNSLFQTLGNFELDPRAGLACIDFDRRRVLSLTGTAEAEFGMEDPAQSTGGTARYWSFTVDRWIEHPLPPTIQWMLIERSPFNP